MLLVYRIYMSLREGLSGFCNSFKLQTKTKLKMFCEVYSTKSKLGDVTEKKQQQLRNNKKTKMIKLRTH